jgi:hypothetical protein
MFCEGTAPFSRVLEEACDSANNTHSVSRLVIYPGSVTALSSSNRIVWSLRRLVVTGAEIFRYPSRDPCNDESSKPHIQYPEHYST